MNIYIFFIDLFKLDDYKAISLFVALCSRGWNGRFLTRVCLF